MKGANIAEISAWLKVRRARFVLNRRWQSSEQTETEFFTRLQAMKGGEITVAEFGERALIVVLGLEASYPDPVEPDDARLSVVIGLQLSARNQAAKAMMADLRSTAAVQLFDVALTLPASFDRGEKVTDPRPALLAQM